MERLIDAYDAILFDLDGTLYRGDSVISGAPEVVGDVREAGKKVVFLTNNSGRSRQQVADKLVEMGIPAASSEVVSSAVATADALRDGGVGVVFAACGPGLREELQLRGIEVVDDAEGLDRVEVVVVGFDPTASYARLRDACIAVQQGARLVASNADVAFPAADGMWPGAGALLSVITLTTGATPEVMGKPAAPLFLSSLAAAGGGRPLVVGDRIDTDIAGAVDLGWDSLLVLTGVTRRADVAARGPLPTWIATDVRGLLSPGAAP